MGLSVTFAKLIDVEKQLLAAPEKTTTALRIALNYATGNAGLKIVREEISKEVAFPAGYLDDQAKLWQSKLASNYSLEARIAARPRATSLARFAMTAPFPTPKGAGVDVTVNPGQTRQMPGAFLIRLRSGASLTEDSYNVGLAIRLKPGQTVIANKRTPLVMLGRNVALLYGPSVDQVAADVFVEKQDLIIGLAQDEFSRQIVRIMG